MTRPGPGGERTVELHANHYAFDPNNIEALEGDQIRFLITNADDQEHNFTVLDPDGEEIESVDVPASTTAAATVTLLRAGKYTFYCNRTFHSLLGMRGQIVSVPR
jgi:plastocyanin